MFLTILSSFANTITVPALAILGGIGPMEIVLIVLVILIFFGAKRLPELAKGLGKGIREFRGAVTDTSDKFKAEIENLDKDDKDNKGSSDSKQSNQSDQSNQSGGTGSSGSQN